MLLNSIKEIKRLRKNINRLLSKGMSNIYLKKLLLTKINVRSSTCKKFITRSLFGELQLTQISWNFKISFRNLEIKNLGANCIRLFYYFNSERNFDVLKSKSPSILLNKNIKFDKNETESKMKNPTYSFRETNLVLQLPKF